MLLTRAEEAEETVHQKHQPYLTIAHEADTESLTNIMQLGPQVGVQEPRVGRNHTRRRCDLSSVPDREAVNLARGYKKAILGTSRGLRGTQVRQHAFRMKDMHAWQGYDALAADNVGEADHTVPRAGLASAQGVVAALELGEHRPQPRYHLIDITVTGSARAAATRTPRRATVAATLAVTRGTGDNAGLFPKARNAVATRRTCVR